MWDALFITYGVRAVYNPNIGKDQNPNWEPRYGVAYSHDLFGITAKVRASYGTATRPPSVGQKDEVRTGNRFDVLDYGTDVVNLANPDLIPSSQQGGEGGLDLYIGNHGSLQITRYNQTVDHLIVAPLIDSLPFTPEFLATHPFWRDRPWAFPFFQSQNVNIGSIRNQGWEGIGTLNMGVFTATGTYSWNKSRLIGITPRYRNQFPQYVVGAPIVLVPEHTYAFGLAYVRGGTRIAYNLQGQGIVQSRRSFAVSRTGSNNDRVRLYNSRFEFPSQYAEVGPGYLLSDLNVSHQFTTHLEGLLQINNLSNSYQSSESDPLVAQPGRVTGLGLRIRL